MIWKMDENGEKQEWWCQPSSSIFWPSSMRGNGYRSYNEYR